uniref:Trafficking protein particle complex subunit n=1 Tax=Octactis speculum TaxID=3111310 RepID=A0A7S2AMS8_9STRA|mmetsp:Transcript_12717/g.16816  ORF Transcript_12717/g.16816 Transcript_12717/m.16816 type:complete len:145 (+) Transcript_12717:45-479(+)
MIYNFYIFDRRGTCLYYREWNRPYSSFSDYDAAEERKLVFGMLFSIKELVSRMSSRPGTEGLHCLKTNNFTLHHLETASGLRFVLNTDGDTGDLRPSLRHIFSSIFVEYVIKNPLYDRLSTEPIDSPLFSRHLGVYLESLSCFR